MDAGLDSLAASELVGQLSSEFNVDLPTTLLFDHPSVASISSFLASFRAPRNLDLEPCAKELEPYAGET